MVNIKEEEIHFIWKHKFYFDKQLLSTAKDKIIVLDPGVLNINSGPDFLSCHIKVNNIDLFGDIEIHKKASDWYSHKHNTDNAYNNVILHIVIDDNKTVINNCGKKMLTLNLSDYISEETLKNISLIFNRSKNVFCIKTFKHLKINYDQLVNERLKHKTDFIFQILNNNLGDWEETFFQFLFYNFGFKINNEEMLQLACSIKYKIIKKNRDDVDDVLALLLGQANLFSKFNFANKDYLYKKYIFLKEKYQLQQPNINWHFFRLRPQNFPTKRLIQLSYILCKNEDLLDLFLNKNINIIQERFLKIKPKISKQICDIFLINTLIPFLVAYQNYHLNDKNKTKFCLKQIKTENNNILRKFNIKTKNAYESQALIELYNSYCIKNKCIFCPLSFQ